MPRKFAKYELFFDGTYTRVDSLEEDENRYKKRQRVDNETYFFSEKKAYRALIKYVKERRDDYDECYKFHKKDFAKMFLLLVFAMFTKSQFLEAFGKIPGTDPCRIQNHIHVTLV